MALWGSRIEGMVVCGDHQSQSQKRRIGKNERQTREEKLERKRICFDFRGN